ncbi:ATP-binding protein [Streptomyces sp. NPDC096068]|uniref:ATP-binding protein n=1 Tax=Streptomyces sp. NPDC096068 TaxID=3155424 RepID=UPI00331B7DAD
MTQDWQFDVPVAGSKVLPPDSRYMEALSSQGYGFDVAVTDLVDNSIDAGAKDVVIHFLRDGDQLVSLLVVDDGHGMNDEQLDVAMTVGGRRGYAAGSLGMFGTGLKAASLSHAMAVTVVSTTKRTRATGRRWLMERAVSGFQCDIVTPTYAQALIDRYDGGRPITWQGTVVRWDGVKDFPKQGGGGQTDRYLQRTINKLGLHLGLHLHRFLAREDFNITIAVEDVRTGSVYMSFGVEPLDPFEYPVSGAPGYPRDFTATLPDLGDVRLRAHIWTPRSNLDEYKAIGSVLDRQGFFFYRHDRLVQAGGWNNFRQPEQHLSLARVAVDLPDESGSVFRLTVKKSGIETSPEFTAALETATDGAAGGGPSLTFPDYLSAADTAYREARKRAGTTRKAVIAPGEGFTPSLRETLTEELPTLPHETPISVEWRRLENEILFDIDRERRAIVLNDHYREAIAGRRTPDPHDAPLVKALLYLLLHQTFEKEYSGSREKDNLQLWQSVLMSAVRSEIQGEER